MTPVFRHGRLRLYLLRLLDEEPRHGYEVIRLLRDRFMGVYAPSPGTIYPRLARLEDEGLVTHDEENGRKVYRITEAGREELRSRGAELDELEEELSESVSDIAREFGEDVRATVRSLREELTRAAREVRQNERDTARDAAEAAREAADAAREQSPAGQGGRLGAGQADPRARPAGARRGPQPRPAAARGGRPAPGRRPRAVERLGQLERVEPLERTARPRPRPRRAARLRAAGAGVRDRPALGRLGLEQRPRQRGHPRPARHPRRHPGADPDRGYRADEHLRAVGYASGLTILSPRTRKARKAKVKVKNQGGLGGEGRFHPALLRKAS